jgi:anti-sigma factor RsiW
MSASTENSGTSSLCDQALDYAYDELSGDAKAAFEAHLATCQKCQTELAQLKRVRGAVKAVLPSVEPPANATGALHAQLIHAAAQRATTAAGGGKVIPFGRRVQKVVLSPAFLAAAMFIIVGGAAGTMWWQGKLDMPAKPRRGARNRDGREAGSAPRGRAGGDRDAGGDAGRRRQGTAARDEEVEEHPRRFPG